MQTIWRFPIDVVDRQVLYVPKGTSFLTAQVKDGDLCLWGIVDPEQPKEYRNIIIVGTGHPLMDSPESRRAYIGTVQIAMGQTLVFHVFEEIDSQKGGAI